ncbi:hypothetical protein PPYR_02567 [Photinus pyralis]|uniref:Uncharacterized protein n=1 Tax=Photinus pyralis TaxID=7054 RepID=A0A5N4B7L7_PHOPY|nr:hypothetical protein PPYR_02567 [Photinus pyralis]
MTEEERTFVPKMRSNNLKIFCNRCNVSLAAIADIKSMVNDLELAFESRIEKLENLITENTTQSLSSKEDTINEAVDRLNRSLNVVLYNVPETPAINDCDFANDILEVIDSTLVVSPGSVHVHRIGAPSNNKPRLRLDHKIY